MREIHRKVMRINLSTTKHSTSEIVLLVSVLSPPIEYPVRGAGSLIFSVLTSKRAGR